VAQFRHLREVPMLVTGGTLSGLGLLLFTALVASDDKVPCWLSAAVLAHIVAPLIISIYIIRYNYHPPAQAHRHHNGLTIHMTITKGANDRSTSGMSVHSYNRPQSVLEAGWSRGACRCGISKR
jgi:hypothetical protein